jgi:ubiquinone biosynthesis protein COQ9
MMCGMPTDQRRTRVLKAALTDAELADFQTAIGHVGQAEAVRQLVRWFTEQPEAIRLAVLDVLPADLRPDIARLMLERMAGEAPPRRRR